MTLRINTEETRAVAWLDRFEKEESSCFGWRQALLMLMSALAAALTAVFFTWYTACVLLFLGFLCCIWDLRATLLIRRGVLATGTILNKKESKGKYFVQFFYTFDDARYTHKTSVWFQVTKFVYNNYGSTIPVRYLPRHPSVCLPRHTIYLRRNSSLNFLSWSYWAGLLVLFSLIFVLKALFSVFLGGMQANARFCLASVLSLAVTFAVLSTGRHVLIERQEHFHPVKHRNLNERLASPISTESSSTSTTISSV